MLRKMARLKSGEISEGYIQEQSGILRDWATFLSQPREFTVRRGHGWAGSFAPIGSMTYDSPGFDEELVPTQQSIIDAAHRLRDRGVEGRLYLAVNPAILSVEALLLRAELASAGHPQADISAINPSVQGQRYFEGDEGPLSSSPCRVVGDGYWEYKNVGMFGGRPMTNRRAAMELRLMPFAAQGSRSGESGEADPELFGIGLPYDKLSIDPSRDGPSDTQIRLYKKLSRAVGGLFKGSAGIAEGELSDYLSIIGAERMASAGHQFLDNGYRAVLLQGGRRMYVETGSRKVGHGGNADSWGGRVYSPSVASVSTVGGGVSLDSRNGGAGAIGFFVSLGDRKASL